MKVITRCVMEWDGEKYVTTEEDSYEYEGPVARCEGGEGQDWSTQNYFQEQVASTPPLVGPPQGYAEYKGQYIPARGRKIDNDYEVFWNGEWVPWTNAGSGQVAGHDSGGAAITDWWAGPKTDIPQGYTETSGRYEADNESGLLGALDKFYNSNLPLAVLMAGVGGIGALGAGAAGAGAGAGAAGAGLGNAGLLAELGGGALNWGGAGAAAGAGAGVGAADLGGWFSELASSVPASTASGAAAAGTGANMSWLDELISSVPESVASSGADGLTNLVDLSGYDFSGVSDAAGGINSLTPASLQFQISNALQKAGIDPASQAGKSLLSKIVNGTATQDDLLGAAGRAIPGILGAFAANQQGDATADLAKQFAEYGAPSRARYEGSFAPGFSMLNEPGYKDALDSTSQGILAKLSATGGNPFGNPGGLIEANKQINAGLAFPALNNYRNQNAATGGFGAFNTAAPGAMAASATSGGDVWNALGSAASSALSPPKSLEDILKGLGGLNLGGYSLA